MTSLNLLGNDIRSRSVTDFLEMRGIKTITLELIDDRAFITAEEQGVSIMAGPEYRIDTLHFYADGVQGSCGYPGELPLNLCFGQLRRDVLATLGPSSKSGGGYASARGETIPKWDRFDLPGFSIHLQFSPRSDSLELVTVMSSDVVPK